MSNSARTPLSDRSVPSTMLVLVGQERAPNAIPIRQFPPGSIKKVEMIYSTFTQPAAKDLRAWLERQGVEVVRRPDLMPANAVNDFNAQRGVVKEILHNYSRGEIFVNLTGGTKIMSLAAADVARGFCPTVYVDTESDSLWWVHPEPRREPLAAIFTVEDFFRLHGQQWDPSAPPSYEEQIVGRALAAGFERLDRLLRHLQRQDNEQLFTYRSSAEVEIDFLKKCSGAKLIESTTIDGRTPHSKNWRMKKARFFRQNDWLECLVFAACREACFDDVRWKIPVSGTTTDLDVAATRGSLMIVCSCKSGKFSNSHLDELDAQARLVGGVFCKKTIVLTEAIPFFRRTDRQAVRQAREALEDRAKTLRIQPFYWTDWPSLGKKMKLLLASGRR